MDLGRVRTSRLYMPKRIRLETPIYMQNALYYYTREGNDVVAYSKRWYIA